MKITTGNFKNPDYNKDHILFIGTHTGTFKRIDVFDEDNPFKQTNLQSIQVLTKDSRITCLNWGDNAKSEILIGRANKFVKIYDCNCDEYSSNLELVDGPIIGLARYDGVVIAGIGNGNIQILQDTPQPTIIPVGDNLSKMKQCVTDRKLIATGGKGVKNNLKICDLTTKTKLWSTKNVPNDSLQLEVPVWDSDFNFFDSNCLVTCSRYGYIRCYDTRKQRRPIFKYESKDQLSFSCLAVHDKLIYVGTTTGGMRAFDSRNLKTHVHTYKGFSGSVSDITIDDDGQYLFTSSLDRFIRVHNANKTNLLYQSYVKSKPTQIIYKKTENLNRSSQDCITIGEDSNEESESEDDSETRHDGDEELDELFDNMEKINENEVIEPPKKKNKKC